MTKFNQAKFESEAKKLVVRCSDYETNGKSKPSWTTRHNRRKL